MSNGELKFSPKKGINFNRRNGFRVKGEEEGHDIQSVQRI